MKTEMKDHSQFGGRCAYSKAMNQPYPRKCIVCGEPEPAATPSHSEEKETTAKHTLNIPTKQDAAKALKTWDYGDHRKRVYVAAKDTMRSIVNAYIGGTIAPPDPKLQSDYSTLKAENERLIEDVGKYEVANVSLLDQNEKLQSDNEAKDKRIQELTEIVEEMSKALKMVKRHGLIEKDGYESTLEQVNRGLVTEALYLTPPIDTKP